MDQSNPFRVHRGVIGILTALLLEAGLALPVFAQEVHRFEINTGDAATAIHEFGNQSGVQILVSADALRGKRLNSIAGDLSIDDGLKKLLADTGLSHRYVGERAVALVTETPELGSQRPDEKKQRSFWERIRLAQKQDVQGPQEPDSSQSVEQKPDQASDREDDERVQLGEVIVTSQKRTERLQDVPLSIAVVTAEDIGRRGLVSAEDYLRGIPGVNQGSTISGSSVIIRGLETSPAFQNFSSGPTVATYFGETPTTNSGGLSNNGSVDIKLVDIERVEVLRGPQGTAFGNASLGGAVRTIPTAPKVDRLEGKVAANYSVTSGYGNDNHMFQAVGNVPLIPDKLAVRAVAYRYADSGFYRNVAGSDAAFRAAVAAFDPQALAFATDVEEIGSSNFTGARLSTLLQAGDDLKFTLTYLTQKTEVDGLPLNNLATDPYAQAGLQVAPEHVVRGESAGLTDTDVDLANITMEYDFGWANLLGTYSYVTSGSEMTRPYSLFAGNFFYAMPISQRATSEHREHVGEIRLATQFEGPWNFLGGLYAEELDDTTAFPFVWYGDPATNPFGGGRYPGNQRDYVDERNLKQRAVFAEASWEFLPGLTLTGGGRAYKYDRTVHVETQGTVYSDQITTDVTEESDTNFRANLSYKPNDNTLVYAAWAQGFRLGKPQPGLPSGLCDLNGDGLIDGSTTPIASTKSVDSDTVDNTELGGKFTLLDRRVTIAAALFRVEWSGMPFLTAAPSPPDGCALNYITNAGAARSEGIELQQNFQITETLRVDIGGSYIRARLTEDVPAQGLPRGTRLPGSPKLNANFGLQYGLNLGGHDAFVRADSIYIGTFSSEMPYSAQAEAGGYMKLDLSAGMAIRHLNVDLFVRNLTNVDDFTFNDGLLSYRLRPRTIGAQLSYDF